MSFVPASPVPVARPDRDEHLRRRMGMATVMVSFVVTFSVVISWDWENGGFLPSAPLTILFACLVAGILFAVTMFGSRKGPIYFFAARPCPSCRRMIPADSNLCPYCGTKLR